jgi:hypothetical protein
MTNHKSSEVAVCDSQKMNIRISHDTNGYVTLREQTSKSVLTVNDENVLAMSEYRNIMNQKFLLVVVEPGMYIIKHMDMCIEYIPNTLRYELQECTSSGYQLDSISRYSVHTRPRHKEVTPLYMDEDTTYRLKWIDGVECVTKLSK